MENTMKKAFFLLVLTLIVAGGVFAQKVGDTVQITGSTANYRVEEIRNDGRVVLVPIVTPEGVWIIGRTSHTIRGTTGVWTDTGEAWLRNLAKTGDLTWTATVVTRNRGSGAWNNCTITLSADGRTMRMSGDGQNWTFTRQ